MAKTVIIDEIHLTLRIPATLPDSRVTVMRRTLNSAAFGGPLRAAILAVVRAIPELDRVRLSLSR